ncbi:MAG: hypothetical protein WCV50_03720 [Patescibacteria group bacterium]|jgi:hypothetical protein
MKYSSQKKNQKFFKKSVSAWLIVLVFSTAIIACTKTALAEWQEPKAWPIIEQLPEPLNTGSQDQTKQGYLELNPAYNPTESNSLLFDPQRPLHVYGEGARFSTSNVYSDIMIVDTDTLYINSINNWVGIGTKIPTFGYMLKIVNGTVKAGDTGNPIDGRAVSAYSSNEAGIYADAGSTGSAGIYALKTEAGDVALKGESEQNVGVQGESTGGTGIYAITDSASSAAVYGANTGSGWAGYFDGWLGTSSDVVGSQFLPTWPGISLVSFTSHWPAGNYKISKGNVNYLEGDLVFDGTYLWMGNKFGDADGNLWKVRASDGVLAAKYDYTGWHISDMELDGQSLWLTEGDAEKVRNISLSDGTEIASCSTLGAQSNWGSRPYSLAVSTINGTVNIWTANQEGGDITKFDSSCNQVGIYGVGLAGDSGTDHENRLYNAGGWRVKPYSALWADGYIWVLTPNSCETGTAPFTGGICNEAGNPGVCGIGINCVQFADNLVKIDPATGAVVARYPTGIATAFKMIFDGTYIWVTTPTSIAGDNYNNEHKLAKIKAADGSLVGSYPIDLTLNPLDLTFDGIYLWIMGDAGKLARLTVATNELVYLNNVVSSNYWRGRMLFDGTYIWTMSLCADGVYGDCADATNKPLRLTKFFSGTGWGYPDVGSVVNLRTREGTCSVTTSQACVFDWHCPASETCNAGHPIQSGNFNVTGDSLVGGNMLVGEDLMAKNNQWGGSDEAVSVSGGVAQCGEGKFIKSVVLDGAGEITQIICRGL